MSDEVFSYRDAKSVYKEHSRFYPFSVYNAQDDKYSTYAFSDFCSFEFVSSSEDSFLEVSAGYENRLDLISYLAYRTVHYWWLIAIANDLIDPFSVPVGSVLRIPSLVNSKFISIKNVVSPIA